MRAIARHRRIDIDTKSGRRRSYISELQSYTMSVNFVLSYYRVFSGEQHIESTTDRGVALRKCKSNLKTLFLCRTHSIALGIGDYKIRDQNTQEPEIMRNALLETGLVATRRHTVIWMIGTHFALRRITLDL